jgi:hypothetical protein
MVKVPKEVKEGLDFVRKSGRTNMFDWGTVAQIALDNGFGETSLWVLENRERYFEGIFEGFEEEEEERDLPRRVKNAVKREHLSIRSFGGSVVIFYKDIPLWRTAVPLQDLDIFLYDPSFYRERGETEEPYSLFCVDKYDDIYTYGTWPTLEEAMAWLENPVDLYREGRR